MSAIERLFATRLYRATIDDDALLDELEASCVSLAEDDSAGRAWSKENGYSGYTSYASLNDLAWRMPAFAALERVLDAHAARFARALDFDLRRKKLVCDSLWVNVLEPGGAHSGHIHPHSVLSGVVYIAVPEGASSIRFEDPRLAMMMAAPMRKPGARADNQTFVHVAPERGAVLMWESWLRHEVLRNDAEEARVSVSFNYAMR